MNICDSGEKAGKDTLYFLVQQRFTNQFSGHRENRKMKNNMDDRRVCPSTKHFEKPGQYFKRPKMPFYYFDGSIATSIVFIFCFVIFIFSSFVYALFVFNFIF